MARLNNPPTGGPVALIKAKKEARRKREIALLLVALGCVVGALVLREPFLVLVSVFPALASYGQR
jgi:hypothetical protein